MKTTRIVFRNLKYVLLIIVFEVQYRGNNKHYFK